MKKAIIFAVLILLAVKLKIHEKINFNSKPKNGNMNPYNFDPTSPNYIESSFKRLVNMGLYPKNVLQQVERIYRLETAHFKSEQYKESLSAGMVYSIDNNILPWKLDGYNVIGYSKPFVVGGKSFRYVQFANLIDGLKFLADYIVRHGGNGSRWFSTSPTDQKNYSEKLSQIIPRYA